MDEPYQTRKSKYSLDKVAFLGLFIAAVVTAWLITSSRSGIALSKPVRLEYGCLSVSTPVGNGWRSTEKWEYERNIFALSSAFDDGSRTVTAVTSCRLMLAPAVVGMEALFQEKAASIEGVIAQTGRTNVEGPSPAEGGEIVVDWAHIKKPGTLFDMFFGTAELGENRRFDIEVYQTAGETELSKPVFEKIAASLRVEKNEFLQAGGRIVSELKKRSITNFSASHFEKADGRRDKRKVKRNFFVIEDTGGKALGFTMDMLIVPADKSTPLGAGAADKDEGASPAEGSLIEGASYYYIRGRYSHEQATSFQSANDFGGFVWKSETSSASGRRSMEVDVGAEGIMTVKRFDGRRSDRSYRTSRAAIPDVFSDFLFGQMLESSEEQIFADIIDAEGQILPAHIRRIRHADQEGIGTAGYEFDLELLDGRGYTEKIQLDEQMRISRRLVRHELIHKIERSSLENVLNKFPERADYVQQTNRYTTPQ
jgi:hypothetical protein